MKHTRWYPDQIFFWICCVPSEHLYFLQLLFYHPFTQVLQTDHSLLLPVAFAFHISCAYKISKPVFLITYPINFISLILILNIRVIFCFCFYFWSTEIEKYLFRWNVIMIICACKIEKSCYNYTLIYSEFS